MIKSLRDDKYPNLHLQMKFKMGFHENTCLQYCRVDTAKVSGYAKAADYISEVSTLSCGLVFYLGSLFFNRIKPMIKQEYIKTKSIKWIVLKAGISVWPVNSF